MNVVAHNLLAMNTFRQAGIVSKSKAKITEKLSSGYRVNRAADDAASLTISEKMRSLIRGLDMGSYNIQDGVSLIQVADGALAEVHDMLHRMNELAVKAANGTNTTADREAIQSEVDNLTGEITRIGKTTEFNTLKIFDDAFGKDINSSVTKYVSSAAADSGYLTEAYSQGGRYYPAAYLDFSNINASNLNFLDGKSFSFTCGHGCGQVFKFTMATDDTPSSRTVTSGYKFDYTVNIKGKTSGAEIVQAINDLVVANQYSGADTVPLAGCAQVAHKQVITTAGSKLVVIDSGYSSTSEAAAKSQYPSRSNSAWGSIDASELTRDIVNRMENDFVIVCSNQANDTISVKTRRINAQSIGVDGLKINTAERAKAAIETVKNAIADVSSLRSDLGAYQNRLESAYDNNQNKAENTQAAESLIRDTNMADAMVKFSKQNILEQVAQAMLTQANQSNQGVLSLLG